MSESMDRLLLAAKKVGLNSAAEVARALNIGDQATTNWRARKVPGSAAAKLQAAYGISASYVMEGTLPMLIGEANIAPLAQAPSVDSSGNVEIVQYDVEGGMSNGGRLLLEDEPPGIIKSWKVDKEWLRLNVPVFTSLNNLCIVTGFGPSMKGMFNPGDPLLMDRGVNRVDHEGVFFFRIGDDGYIKIIQRIPKAGGGRLLRAKSKNPEFDPFEIDESTMDFHVLGKILTVWKSEQY